MNNPHFGTYRGWSAERDEWVYGAYHKVGHLLLIMVDDSAGVSIHVPVFHESLAMFTGVYDSEDKPIYGSFPLPDGTMSKGGDIITGDYITADNSFGELPNGWTFNKDEDKFLVILDKKNAICTFDFEDDIPESVKIEFGDASHAYMAKYKSHARDLLIVGEGELIGNAYENPKLLEENQ